MNKRCAWCKQDLGDIEGECVSAESVSHGLCPACSHRLFAQMGMPLHQYLDGLGAPVAVISAEGMVMTANAQACEMLGKGLALIEGHAGGQVFECEHSFEPEGCGGTVHCSGCTIRRTVMDSHATGRSHYNVPAYLRCKEPSGMRDLEFLISTEPVGGVVLLRVDAVVPRTPAR